MSSDVAPVEAKREDLHWLLGKVIRRGHSHITHNIYKRTWNIELTGRLEHSTLSSDCTQQEVLCVTAPEEEKRTAELLQMHTFFYSKMDSF